MSAEPWASRAPCSGLCRHGVPRVLGHRAPALRLRASPRPCGVSEPCAPCPPRAPSAAAARSAARGHPRGVQRAFGARALWVTFGEPTLAQASRSLGPLPGSSHPGWRSCAPEAARARTSPALLPASRRRPGRGRLPGTCPAARGSGVSWLAFPFFSFSSSELLCTESHTHTLQDFYQPSFLNHVSSSDAQVHIRVHTTERIPTKTASLIY